MSIPRKYVDSHWLVFVFQGAIMLLFGWFIMFANVEKFNTLVAAIGSCLLGLGIIELFNLLRRTHLRETWVVSLVTAVFEIGVAFSLLFTLNLNPAYHLAIIAGYTAIRGLMEIILGLRAVDDRTDKFIWVIIGVCGCILGFVILNSATFADSLNFIKIFGSYLMLAGLANLIYGVHNHDQSHELALSYEESAKKAARTRKTTRTKTNSSTSRKSGNTKTTARSKTKRTK